jgi:integrase
MSKKKGLTQTIAKDLKLPKSGSRLYWDSEFGGVRNFGLRVTANGVKTFIFLYRIHRRQRWHSIGRFDDPWSVDAARHEAGRLQQEIDKGVDPVAQLEKEERKAQEEEASERSLKQLADAYLVYFAERIEKDNRRPRTLAEYKALVDGMIIPPESPSEKQRESIKDGCYLGPALARAVSERMVAEWHLRWKAAPYRANRALALLHAMFTWAIKADAKNRANQQAEEWHLPTNPAAGVEKYHEEKRKQYLTEAELQRLAAAMNEYPAMCAQEANISEKQRDWLQIEAATAMDALRLMMLTGCRKGEALCAKWADFDIARGVWTKPRDDTKEKKVEHVSLNEQALALLARMERKGEHLFPGRYEDHLADVKHPWAKVCELAKLSGWRIHDLRHSFASFLVSQGVSLETIGALLGHRQAQTTKRYAHVDGAANKFPLLPVVHTVQ